jgi:hypothetical protein
MINQINRNDEIVIPNGMTFKETEENGEPIIYLDKQLKELFEFYNQIGAEYIDFGNHAMDLRFKYNGFETSTSYHQVNVNENYFINRMNIELDSSLIMDDSLDYMIVPKTFYDENRAGELNCYEAVQCKIIDVDTTGSIYNYNSHIGYPVSRKLTDPVIKIVNNFGTTSFDITKYLIHSSIDELTELEKSSGIQASVSYQRFSDFKQEEFKNVKRYFIENISDSYIYIVLVVLIISQYILLYTISNQKEISVKILNGYSLVESLDEVTKNIILSIIPISIYMIVKGYNLFHTMIFILILFIVAYISITLVASRMLGNMKNIIAWGKKL